MIHVRDSKGENGSSVSNLSLYFTLINLAVIRANPPLSPLSLLPLSLYLKQVSHGGSFGMLVQPYEHRRGHGGASVDAHARQIRMRAGKQLLHFLRLLLILIFLCRRRRAGLIRLPEAVPEAQPQRVGGYRLAEKQFKPRLDSRAAGVVAVELPETCMGECGA